MSQQPSDQYTHSIQTPSQGGSHRRIQVYPIERTNEATPYDPGSRAVSSAPGDPQYQQWYRARADPAIQTTPGFDYHTPQHYASVDGHPRELGEDLERVPWREGPSQTAGAFYTQESHVTPIHSSQPTSIHSPRDHQRHTSTWEQEGQGRRSLERGYDHRDAHHFNSPRESRSEDAVQVAPGDVGSHANLDRKHHGLPMVARHPSFQSFGPYTTTVLHSGRNPPTLSSAGDPSPSRSPSHTPYSAQQQYLTHQAIHSTETPQYVVPSSRIPRPDSGAHPSSAGLYNTPRVSHSPEETSETKPKRRRANAAQLQLLNDTYARTMFPTTEERADIARRINMTPRQVQIWFQNRRQASRQSQTLEPGTPSGSPMEGVYDGHPEYEPEND